jgi:hypothetical protein
MDISRSRADTPNIQITLVGLKHSFSTLLPCRSPIRKHYLYVIDNDLEADLLMNRHLPTHLLDTLRSRHGRVQPEIICVEDSPRLR